ncbi:MAG TPA: aldehyde dehydrogenase [Gemmatimonadetes bacterium]|jgi:acyl-CoA reductase-like NAD-dependent aldehyde dehydrogenase|nr:aldehyde dehydrogenase [Chloroflexota bacterium]HAF20681.1 aldehyde dehydrogenase [Chloroflexota bacterium]HCU10845.1 aldehyde dehydrogenase [Gemmatimonadota bacterium]
MPAAKSGNGRVEVRKTYKLFINGEFVRSESGRAYRFDGNVNIPRGSRKDLRDAVRAARGAVSGWAARTAMNRGQILYRAAEMLDGRRAQFVDLLGSARAAHKEVDDAVEALVWYAGWTDKLAQVIGATNPVSGPYFNFTIPEPTGVVGIVAPEEPALVGLVRRMAPALCGGNALVVLAPEETPLPALTLAEVLATSDLPVGVVNVLSGYRKELLPWLASHMDVNAIDVAGCTPDEVAEIEKAAADNVKRVVKHAPEEMSPYLITAFMEMKTVWHPVGV